MPNSRNVWESFNEETTPEITSVSQGNENVDSVAPQNNPYPSSEGELDFSPTISIGSFTPSAPKEMVFLEPGEYTATITDITRSIHEASEKLPRCPQVTVEFTVKREDGVIATCNKLYYIIHRKWAEQQIYFLFKAAKLIEGNTFSPDWDALRDVDVHITVDDSEVNGRTYHNNVVRVDPFGEEDLPF